MRGRQPTETEEVQDSDWYVNFGRYRDGWRVWDDARTYGFLCAGGGRWFSDGLREIGIGERVWAYLPINEVPNRPHGYGGVGYAKGPAVRAHAFILPDGQTLLQALGLYANNREYNDDPDKCEWFLPVEWVQTVSEDHLFWEVGMYAVETIAVHSSSERWLSTLARLRERFPDYARAPSF